MADLKYAAQQLSHSARDINNKSAKVPTALMRALQSALQSSDSTETMLGVHAKAVVRSARDIGDKWCRVGTPELRRMEGALSQAKDAVQPVPHAFRPSYGGECKECGEQKSDRVHDVPAKDSAYGDAWGKFVRIATVAGTRYTTTPTLLANAEKAIAGKFGERLAKQCRESAKAYFLVVKAKDAALIDQVLAKDVYYLTVDDLQANIFYYKEMIKSTEAQRAKRGDEETNADVHFYKEQLAADERRLVQVKRGEKVKLRDAKDPFPLKAPKPVYKMTVTEAEAVLAWYKRNGGSAVMERELTQRIVAKDTALVDQVLVMDGAGSWRAGSKAFAREGSDYTTSDGEWLGAAGFGGYPQGQPTSRNPGPYYADVMYSLGERPDGQPRRSSKSKGGFTTLADAKRYVEQNARSLGGPHKYGKAKDAALIDQVFTSAGA